MINRFFLWFCGLMLVCAPLGVQAQSSMSDIVQTEVLNGWRQDDGSHMMAVRFKLAPGWKTYWRAPGGGGIPPQFNWSRSDNIRSVRPIWPAPKILELAGQTTLGYTDELILPMEVIARDASKPILVNTSVDFGVCEDICVPVQTTLKAVLQDGEAADQSTIKAALKKRVPPARGLGLQQARCKIDLTKDGYLIAAHLDFKSAPQTLHTVIEYQAPEVWVEAAHSEQSGRAAMATAEMMSFRDSPLIFQRDRLRITIFADGKVGEVLGCPAL